MRPTARQTKSRRANRLRVETLEDRTLLSVSVSFNSESWTAGVSESRSIGTLTYHTTPDDGAFYLVATVNWGDTGATDTVFDQSIMNLPNYTFDLMATHTFAEPGRYPISVTVNEGTNYFPPFNAIGSFTFSTMVDVGPKLTIDNFTLGPDAAGGVEVSYTVAGDVLGDVSIGIAWSTGFSATPDFSINRSKGTHRHTIPGSQFGYQPDGATGLVLSVYTHGTPILVQNSNPNLSVPAPQPTVRFLQPTGDLSLGEDYDVRFTIQNDGYFPQRFNLNFFETFSVPLNNLTVPARNRTDYVLNPLNPGAAPLEMSFSQLDGEGAFNRRWDWIPPQNPISVEGTLKDLVTGETQGKVVEKVTPLVESFDLGDRVALFEVASAIQGIIKDLVNAKTVNKATYTLNVGKANGSVDTQQYIISLAVPLAKKEFFNAFHASTLTASTTASAGVAALMALQPEIAVPIFAKTAALLFAARTAYDQAVDPPDANFTELVVPQFPSIPAVDNLPDGPLKTSALLQSQWTAYQEAAAKARDKALGAQIAGNDEWQARQLIAAAEFDTQAAALQSDLANYEEDFADAVGPILEAHRAGIPGYFQANGIPSIAMEVFQAAGFSASEIADLFEGFEEIDPDSVQTIDAVSLGGVINSISGAMLPSNSTVVRFEPHALAGGVGPDNFGPATLSAFGPLASGVSQVTGLTRGDGVDVPEGISAAAGSWGGAGWDASTGAEGVSNGQSITFGLVVAEASVLSLASIELNYQRTADGPVNGFWEFQVGAGDFQPLADVSGQFASDSSSGASIAPISLIDVWQLQNLRSGTAVQFRLTPYGGGPNGLWSVFDIGNTDLGDDFVVNALLTPAPPTPSIVAIAADSGPTAGGYQVTIDGTHFTPDASVFIDGVPASEIEFISPTQFLVRVQPRSTPGTVDVSVETSGGVAVAPGLFTFIAPTTTTLASVDGIAALHTPVTLTATVSGQPTAGFVTFYAGPGLTNPLESPIPVVDGVASLVTSMLPAGQNTVVAAYSGSDFYEPSQGTTIVSLAAPTITSVTPNIGAATVGSFFPNQIQIHGTHFSGVTSVKFGSIEAASFIIMSDSQINVYVPQGAGVVDVTVATPLGSSPITPAARFTYIPPLQVASLAFTPDAEDNTLGVLDIRFNQPFAPETFQSWALFLGQGYSTDFEAVEANMTARFQMAGVMGDGKLAVTLYGGAFETLDGIESSFFTGFVSLEAPAVPFPLPLDGISPEDIDASTGRVHDTFITSGDVDEYTIELAAGQRLSVELLPQGSFGIAVEVRDPAGRVVAHPSGIAGQAARAQNLTANEAGTYRFILSAEENQIGSYSLAIFLNAWLEGETRTQRNDSPETAATFDGSFVSLPNGVGQSVVFGQADPAVTYTPQSLTTAFEDISGSGNQSVLAVGDDEIDSFSTEASGFSFSFFGQTYDTFYVTTNGLITLGFPFDSPYPFNLESFSFAPVIAPLWADFIVDGTGSGSNASALFWEVLGENDDQRLIIQWNNVRYDSFFTTPPFSFQTILSRNGTIQFNYGPLIDPSALYNATVGIADGEFPPTSTMISHAGFQPLGLFVESNKSFQLVPSTEPTSDYYTIELAANQSISLAIASDFYDGNELSVELLDDEGTSLGFGDRNPSLFSSVGSTFTAPAAGVYTFKVDGPHLTDYRIIVQTTNVPAPAVTSIGPAAGSANGGTMVLIIGQGFTTASAVAFGGVPAISFTVDSQNQITAIAPPGSGAVPVVVTTAGGTSSASANSTFTYIAAPTVASIAPVIGPTTGGTLVVITGSNFVSITAILVDGQSLPAASYTVISDSEIIATAPAHTAGTVDIEVINAGGTGSLSGFTDFTYATPAVASVEVNSGLHLVTLAGTGSVISLAGQNSVVKHIVVTFNQAVTVASDAFTVTPRTSNVTVRGGAAPSNLPVQTSVTQLSVSEYLVTFNGPGTRNGVIDSGVYDLTTLAGKVTANGEVMTANRVDSFFAMFGTINGNNSYTAGTIGNGGSRAFVDPGSLFQFSDAFGSNAAIPVGPPAYNAIFDSNLDGSIDPGDLFAFSDSFGITWDF